MRTWKNRYLKALLILFAIIVVPIVLYFGMAVIGLLVPTNPEVQSGPKDYTIYIAVESIHADFILPVETDVIDWRTIIPTKDFKNISSYPKFIQLGWGDEVFYLEMGSLDNFDLDIGFRAAFLPTDSLMHVTYYYSLPYNYIDIREIKITRDQYKILVAYIKKQFKTENDKLSLLEGKSYYWNDNFYRANESYHLFNTCNMWTNRGLKKIGVKTSIWSPFKYGIRNFLPPKKGS